MLTVIIVCYKRCNLNLTSSDENTSIIVEIRDGNVFVCRFTLLCRHFYRFLLFNNLYPSFNSLCVKMFRLQEYVLRYQSIHVYKLEANIFFKHEDLIVRDYSFFSY